MKLRDKLNTEEGYFEIISEYIEFIQEDLGDLKGYDEQFDQDKIRSTYWSLFKYAFKILKAKYSLGEDIAEIIKLIPDCILYLDKSWRAESGYVQMINMLSICILLEIKEDEFNKLVKLVERDKVKDYLIDFLIRYRRPDWQLTDSFLWDNPYKAISEIVEFSKEDKEKSLGRLKKYLTKEWYRSWDAKDTHKSKWNIHTGYWSFEAGAVAKILELDDSSLKEQQYYPYDMVHFKD